jgi:hypothetical protein
MSPLTVAILRRQHPLQGGARASPSLILQVVAAAVGRAILVEAAVGRSRTRVGNNGVQDAERGQCEAALIRAQLEPEHMRSAC